VSSISILKRLNPHLRIRILIRARRQQKTRAARWTEIQSSLALIGGMTISWAAIERMFDELIAWYQHRATQLDAKHPISLSNKLDYLRTMQRDERFNSEIREFLRVARIEAKRLGTLRHDLIHGVLHRRAPGDFNWYTQRVVYDGPYARLAHRTYTPDELRDVTSKIAEFGGYLSPKVWAIIGGDPSLVAASDLEQARRELGMT
jgi:hypothetical protein